VDVVSDVVVVVVEVELIVAEEAVEAVVVEEVLPAEETKRKAKNGFPLQS